MKKVFGFILTFVCCSALLFGLFSLVQAEEQAAVAQSEMEEYTKDDYFYFDRDRDGVLDECQVQDYADSLHLEDIRQSDLFNSNCETIWKPSIERFSLTAAEDDPIVKIVPKNLFVYENKTLHIGKEYGFFIETLNRKTHCYSNLIVFDFENKVNLPDTKDHAYFNITVLFQREYVYALENGGYEGGFLIESENLDVVMPLPQLYVIGAGNIHVRYAESTKYYVSDIINSINIRNEQHLNESDPGYKAIQDKGRFITMTDASYNAMIYNANDHIFRDESKFVLKTAFDVAFDALLKSHPVIGTVKNVAEFLVTAGVLTLDSQEAIGREFTYVPNYVTNEGQIRDKGYLSRYGTSMLCIPDNGEYSDNDFVYIQPGGSFTVDYQLSYTSAQDEQGEFLPAWQARIDRLFNITIRDREGNEIAREESIYSFPTVSEKKILQAQDIVSILPQGKNIYQFNTPRNGYYRFSTVNAPYLTNLAEIDEDDLVVQNGKKIGNDASIEIYLKQGEKRYFNISFEDPVRKGNFIFRVDFVPQVVGIGQNNIKFDQTTEEYFRIHSDQNYYFRLKISENNILLYELDSKFNAIGAGKTELVVEHGSGYKYFKLISGTSLDVTVSVAVQKERNVGYESNSGQFIPTQILVNDASITFPDLELRSGYDFAGWWPSQSFEGDPVNVNNFYELNFADITLYAKWDPIQYSIDFVGNGGTNLASINYTIEDSIQLPSIQKNGCIFLGWYDNAGFDGQAVTTVYVGSVGNKTFYARWVFDKYQITIDLADDEVDSENGVVELKSGTTVTQKFIFEVEYGKTFTLPVANTRGFIFNGWFMDDEQITTNKGTAVSSYTYENSIIVKADWTREVYKIQVVIEQNQKILWMFKDGLSEIEQSIAYEENLCPNCKMISLRNSTNAEIRNAAINALYRPGYKYSYLKDSKGGVACFHNLVNNGEYEVYAVYQTESYTLNYSADNQTIAKHSYYIGENIRSVPYTKTGYTFQGWSLNGKIFKDTVAKDYTPNSERDAELILYPVMQANEYTIYFDGYDETVKVRYGESASGIFVPEEQGYKISGWYTQPEGNGDCIINAAGEMNFAYPFAEDITVYLNKTAIEYKIYYNLNGGTLDTLSASYTVESSFIFAIPTKEGYRFTGWYKTENFEGEKIETTDNCIGDLNLYASWSKLYTLTLKNGNQIKTLQGIIGEKINLPTPKKYMHRGVWRFYPDFNSRPYIYTDYAFGGEYAFGAGDAELSVIWYVVQSTTIVRRNEEFTITDAAKEDNKSDDISLSKFNINYSSLIGAGFTNLYIYIEMDIKELDDGYQEIYICNGSKTLWEQELEHGGTKKDGNYAHYKFNVGLKLSDLNSGTLSLRYGAHGRGSDNWCCKNLTVKVEVTKA